jgi:hypothetical protein
VIDFRQPLDRRLFLACGLGIINPVISPGSGTEHVYRFATRHCNVHVRIEFHDRYSSRGFWFSNRSGGAPFCLSSRGEQNRHCLMRFVGSLAIAQYEVHSRSKQYRVSVLREYVRTIDRDERLDPRPPFDRRLELQAGKASDIQAFGYEERDEAPTPEIMAGPVSPWYYFRQDLYLEPETTPFLIIHWKHELTSIRMLDMIPGEGTSPVEQRTAP